VQSRGQHAANNPSLVVSDWACRSVTRSNRIPHVSLGQDRPVTELPLALADLHLSLLPNDEVVTLLSARPSADWSRQRVLDLAIGAGFVPSTLDQGSYDQIIRIKGQDAVKMTAKLTKDLGLFCGISTGANILASCQLRYDFRFILNCNWWLLVFRGSRRNDESNDSRYNWCQDGKSSSLH